MAKPMVVTLPALLLLFDWWPLGRRRRIPGRGSLVPVRLVVEKLPLLALSIGTAFLTLVAQQREGAVNLMDQAHRGLRYASALLSYVRYLGMSSGADRYTYLPLVGVVLSVVWSLRQLVARRGAKALRNGLILAACLLLPVLGWLTRRQLDTWRSSQALFDRVREVDPVAYWRSSTGEYNLAVELTLRGNLEEAKMRYAALLRGGPGRRAAGSARR